MTLVWLKDWKWFDWLPTKAPKFNNEHLKFCNKHLVSQEITKQKIKNIMVLTSPNTLKILDFTSSPLFITNNPKLDHRNWLEHIIKMVTSSTGNVHMPVSIKHQIMTSDRSLVRQTPLTTRRSVLDRLLLCVFV